MTDSITKRLLNLKETITESKTKLDQSEGRMIGLKEQLKDFGCDTIKQAEKKLKELDEEILENEDILEKGIKELESKINVEED